MVAKELVVVAFFFVVCEIVAFEDIMYDDYDGEDEVDPPESPYCAAKNSVCASLMMTSAREEVIDEGELCKCAGCVRSWGDKTDKRAVTWYHQERRDFIIQYRLCAKILPDETCAADETNTTLKITTGIGNWKPKVASARCQCKDGIFHLAGWWRRRERWEYSYTCSQPICDVSRSEVCFKQYRNSDDGVNGVKFPCGCPEGFKCPLEEENTRSGGHDEDGDYSVGLCVPLHGGKPVQS